VIDDVIQTTATDVAPIIQNLDDDLSQIFVNASRDGKITADEIGNAFQAMALRIIQTQVFDKLFAGAGPLGEIAGNLLGGGPNITINQTVRFDTAVHNDMTAHILAALPAIKNVAADEVMNRLKGIRYR
jgi:hypothetical protein